jgi:CRP-like cAMP-binding protein
LLERLDREKTLHSYRNGQTIFYQGNPSLAAYCISEGHVKLYKSGRDGSETLLRLLGPGNVMGYRALLSAEHYAASAEAVGDTKICVISKETFFEILQTSPEFCMKVMHTLSVELRISEDEMIARIRDSVPRRAAKLLLKLLHELGDSGDGDSRLVFPFPRRQLALMIGTSPETLSRTLRSMADKGLLSIAGRQVYIRDMNALESLAFDEPNN